MTPTTHATRESTYTTLSEGTFDVLVIGGGITGAGVALDAATRGLRTALLEAHDFASGTSSKSSKLVHGGIRYLQQKEIKLVYEALHERYRLLKNAPHLVELLPFLIPTVTKDGLINPKLARAVGTALWLYYLTGGYRVGKLHQRLTKEEAVERLPTLPIDRLASAYLYFDAAADDARLTLAVAQSAAAAGAVVLNYCPTTDLVRDDAGKVSGVVVATPEGPRTVRARVVINAAGVWSDQIRAMAEPGTATTIRPAKGVHIAVPWSRIRNTCAAVIPTGKDGRSIFVVRWEDTAYLGTTDTDYDGDIDTPMCTPEDVDYLLEAANRTLTADLTRADILGTWAGLRPLLAGDGHSTKTADLSRGHQVRTSASTMLTITGGKLTTYRRMAADTVDAACRILGVRSKSVTKKRRLYGAADPVALQQQGIPHHLAHRYGSNAHAVLSLTADPSLALPLVPGLPYLRAEAIYAVRSELATTLDDVLSRRTRARLLDAEATWKAAPSVAALIAPELGWDEARIALEVSKMRKLITDERIAAGLSSPTENEQTVGAS